MSRYRSHDEWLWLVPVLMVLVGVLITLGLRGWGIRSCRDRSGIPITNSWVSHDPWDVRCLGGK
jgi:hypothetical protein